MHPIDREMNGPQRRPITPIRIASRSPSPVSATQTTNASQYTGLQTAVALNTPRATIASIEKNRQTSRPQSASLVQARNRRRSVTNANIQAMPPPPPLAAPQQVRYAHGTLQKTQRFRNLLSSQPRIIPPHNRRSRRKTRRNRRSRSRRSRH
jgi:hypothetical protein